MIPPKEYFEQVPEGTPGAQRIGLYWFAFISPDSLFDMMNDGVFEEADDGPLSESVFEQIEVIEAELAELRTRLEAEK